MVSHLVQKRNVIDTATIQKGADYLGFVKPIPIEEQFTSWRSEYEADIMVSLASLVGERMFFDGDSSSGRLGRPAERHHDLAGDGGPVGHGRPVRLVRRDQGAARRASGRRRQRPERAGDGARPAGRGAPGGAGRAHRRAADREPGQRAGGRPRARDAQDHQRPGRRWRSSTARKARSSTAVRTGRRVRRRTRGLPPARGIRARRRPQPAAAGADPGAAPDGRSGRAAIDAARAARGSARGDDPPKPPAAQQPAP